MTKNLFKTSHYILVLISLFALDSWREVSRVPVYLRSEYTYEQHHLAPVKKIPAQVTAYTSSINETDDTPFLTASGEMVGPGTLACPSHLKFGTIVQIENNFYTCSDRMNKRFRNTNHFDIWVESKEIALDWGRKNIDIYIVEEVIPNNDIK